MVTPTVVLMTLPRLQRNLCCKRPNYGSTNNSPAYRAYNTLFYLYFNVFL